MKLSTVVDSLAKITDSVLVGLSCGKDSLAVLDLCASRFKRVECYFLYLVPGLEFQERYLRYCEKRWNVKVHRRPHWQLAGMLKAAAFRPYSPLADSVKLTKISDTLSGLRQDTGIRWVCTGERASDSLHRRLMLKACEAIDVKRAVAFPLAWWTNGAVYGHLKAKRIPLPPDYAMFGRSFGRLHAEELFAIAERYPEDCAKILRIFPFAQAQLKRQEYGSIEVSEVPAGDDHQGADQKCPVQPAEH